MRRLTFLAAAALLGLTACGDDSTSSATTTAVDAGSDTTTAAVDETVSDDTVVASDDTVIASDDTVIASDDTGGGEGADTEFCAINQELNDTDIPLEGTPADLEAYFTGFFPEALGRLEGAVPPELAADVDTLIAGVSQIGALLEANEWNAEAAFADPAFTELATNPEFEAAGNRVDEFCGL